MRAALRLSGLASAALLALCPSGVGDRAAAQSPAFALKAPDSAALLERAGRAGSVRVIVRFAADDEPLDSAAERARRARKIALAQDDILAAASIRSPRRLARMRIEPMFALDADANELAALANDGRVLRIQPDHFDRPRVNEPEKLIGQPSLRRLGGTGEGQIVVVIDTGVAPWHPFIRDRVVAGACFATDKNGYESTCPGERRKVIGRYAGEPCRGSGVCTHGTTVAGIVAGRGDRGDPIKRGVAPGARLMAINVYSRAPDGGVGAFASDQIRALEHVFERQKDFQPLRIAAITMSLGNGDPQPSFCDDDPRAPIIRRLRNAAKIATVIAAGNEYAVDGVSAPGCISYAVTVGAVTDDDRVASFSNNGPQVDLLAPGQQVVAPKRRGFGPASGTSFAVPYVAGAVAALRSIRPGASVYVIEKALESTGVPVADTRPGGTLTKPRLDLGAAGAEIGR